MTKKIPTTTVIMMMMMMIIKHAREVYASLKEMYGVTGLRLL